MNYTQRGCQLYALMKKIEDKCQCYPSYDEQLHKLHRSKPCNFFEHSTCVAKIHNTNDQFEFMKECLPACDHTTVHQEGIHVSHRHLKSLILTENLSTRKWTLVWRNIFVTMLLASYEKLTQKLMLIN